MKTLVIRCDCFSAEHMIILTDDGDCKYFQFQIVQYRNVWKRIWVAIKYALGYKSRYGHWDTTIVSPEQYKEIAEFFSNPL
jgi:hypothetical protein